MDYVHNPIAFEHVAALDGHRLAIFDERAYDFLLGRHQLVSALAGPRKPLSAFYVALARLEQHRRVGRALGLGTRLQMIDGPRSGRSATKLHRTSSRRENRVR